MINIQLKTTNLCNMNCSYCYTPEFKENKKIDQNAVRKAFNFAKDLNKNRKQAIQFIWHGGEPSLLSRDFYKRSIKLQKEKLSKTKILNFFQTNGWKLDKDIINLLAKNNFVVGLSLDGPKKFNNKYRKGNNKIGSFDRIINAYNLLKEKGIPTVFNCTLRKKSLNMLDEIYKIFRNLNCSTIFNILIPSKSNINYKYKSNYLRPGDYGEFICSFLKRWVKDKEFKANVDTYNYIVWSIVNNTKFGCFKSECLKNFFAFNPEGRLYTCGRFYGLKKHELNLRKNNKLRKEVYSQINSKYRKINCSSCALTDKCEGGCIYDRYMINKNNLKPDIYCKDYLMIAEYTAKNRKVIKQKMNENKKRYSRECFLAM